MIEIGPNLKEMIEAGMVVIFMLGFIYIMFR